MIVKTVPTILCLLTAVARAQSPCAISDDVGDTTTAAVALLPGATQSRLFERRHDRDLYSFQALPGTTYTITATPAASGGVTDTEFQIFQADGRSLVVKATSSGTRTFAQAVIPVGTFARQVYVDTRPFAEYSSGGYTLRLDATLPTDSDNDGLPSTWETTYGLNPSDPGLTAPYTNGPNGDPDGDGMNNRDEWLAGTNPTLRASVLRIQSMQFSSQRNLTLRWPAQQFARYQVYRGNGSTPSSWTLIGTILQQDTSGTGVFTDTNADVFIQQAYRVELVY